ncbi:MAG: PASTA domain-containing protein [Candidatus Kapabacteria bacterium]|nr:PASTA domain-containing protein [Candidatus Kapabacteria bacterium]
MWTWRKIGIASAAMIGVTVLSLLIVDQIVLPWIVSTTDTVIVPEVTGRPFDEARGLLEIRRLRINEIRYQHSTDVKPGTVMSQLPYAGATVKEGRRVYLTVSKGIEMVTVPNLIGLSMRDARLALARAGLQLGSVTNVTDDNIPVDGIAWQSPAAGSSTSADGSVSIGISRGSILRMPSLIGMRLDEAKGVLAEIGLTVGTVRERATQAFAAGTIIDQLPQPDSTVSREQDVSITLAR